MRTRMTATTRPTTSCARSLRRTAKEDRDDWRDSPSRPECFGPRTLSGSFYDRLLTRIGFVRVNLSTPGEPAGFDWISFGRRAHTAFDRHVSDDRPKQVARPA